MPRPKLIDRPSRLEVTIPESISAKVRIELFSGLEGRVPHGAWSRLITGLLTEWLQSQRGVE